MQLKESEEDLLKRAWEEENAYNWLNSLKLYDQAAKSYINKKDNIKAIEIFNDLTIKYYLYGFSVKTAEEYLEILKTRSKLFKEAAGLFRQKGNELESLELEIGHFYSSLTLANSIEEGKKMANKALELSYILYEAYSKKDDKQIPLRIMYKLSLTLTFYLSLCEEPEEIKKVAERIIELSRKAWKLSIEKRKMIYIVFSLFSECFHIMLLTHIDSKWLEESKDAYKNIIYKCDESIKFFKTYNNPFLLPYLYYTYGCVNCEYGHKHTDDEIEQRNYFDKGFKFLEMGLELARKVKNKYLNVMTLYYINQYAILSGNYMYLQKRIMNDIKEISEAGKIFAGLVVGLFDVAYFYVNYLPTFYYSNISQLSFFTPNQRKSYAKKGIEFGLKTLGWNTYEEIKSFSYMSLTLSYAVLARFSKSKEEMEIYVKSMFDYANKGKKLGEKYGEGLMQAFVYNSLNRAYKTLADITKNKQERIKMLSLAADASKNYLKYAKESRTGIIAAQMRLAFLYEEIGIFEKDEEILTKAEELLYEALKSSLEKGYYSYAGTTYEYIARIEDRLGNHTASAENYMKAQEYHKKSLESIKYRALKARVNEKIQYAHAWILIEKAKAYHKNENHIKAKENFENSSEILKKISKYYYEGFYNAAWAMLEEAEFLSKQEKQEEAINQYKNTIQAFEETISILKEALAKSKDQPEKERIQKLEKVAEVRINYCSARINLEEALILGRKGNHSTAAEKFAIAASIFRGVCTRYKLERERKELEAIYYLCRAWESMELGEKYEEPERFDYAADLFTKASDLFVDIKLKLLASGNSAFCQALELGCKFDESVDIDIKTNLYPRVKLMLSKAASYYGKSGFENVANWALATSIYFDAAWHLIQADKEMDINEKGRLLGIGSNYLKSSVELFEKAGYKNKVNEVQDRLNRVEKEESILFSALSTINEPSISRSTMGIVAPSCPIESSYSPRLGEARQFTEEELRVTMERMKRKKYELIYKDLIKDYSRVQRRECRIGVAQIGVSETGNIIDELFESSPSGLLKIREDKIEKIRSQVKFMIEKAYNEGINILLFPEMTVDLNYGEFLEDIADQAKLYEMYIVPGSFHELETKRNICKVFGPEGILWEQEKHIPATISFEAGKPFKEGIKVDKVPRKTIICNTEYGRIVIAICRDFLDMDLRVELKNFESPIDIILNPAFTPVTADFKAAHFDARRSIYAYSFFANIGEYGESLIYTPEKDRTEQIIPPKEEGLIFKDINIFKLRSERKKWEKENNKEQLFIQSTR
ncbi:MAG: hypothetical protein ACFE88_14745 [Candidatus Hermodarchaeota archaeon]